MNSENTTLMCYKNLHTPNEQLAWIL